MQGGHGERKLLNDLMAFYQKLERPVANESEAVQLKFGLTLQQIMDVVSDAFIKLPPATSPAQSGPDEPTAHTLISSRLGGNVFSIRKLNAFSSILERKERFQPTRSNNVFKHKPGPDCNQPEGTECDYYANIVTPQHRSP